nr:sialic acid-binding Ig-like lectin 15 [Vulpes vulpes]
MEWSIRLLACLVGILPMGSFVRTKRDTTGNLLNTEVHSAPAQRWSMQVPAEVSAAAGEAAVLPCTFTHPHRHYDGPLTAIWRAGEVYAGPQVFRCAAARGSELCQTALSLHGRFRLLGNPRRNDLSLRVERLALADDGRYFCRVEFAGDVHDRYESRHGVRLRVTAAPRIVSLSVLPGPAHAFRALCTAEGEPPPVLAWSGPALGNRSAAASGPKAERLEGQPGLWGPVDKAAAAVASPYNLRPSWTCEVQEHRPFHRICPTLLTLAFHVHTSVRACAF